MGDPPEPVAGLQGQGSWAQGGPGCRNLIRPRAEQSRGSRADADSPRGRRPILTQALGKLPGDELACFQSHQPRNGNSSFPWTQSRPRSWGEAWPSGGRKKLQPLEVGRLGKKQWQIIPKTSWFGGDSVLRARIMGMFHKCGP